MIVSQDIQFWQIRKREGRRKPWEVRWRVNTHQFSRSFTTKALAENFRAKLLDAARKGETFSLVTGEPGSWARSEETMYTHARRYVEVRWPESAAMSRRLMAATMARVTLAHLRPLKAKRNTPDRRTLSKALQSYAFNPSTWTDPVPDNIATALEWVAAASRPVADLGEAETVRELLTEITKRADGKPGTLSLTSNRGHRTRLFGLLGYAVERKLLTANPLLGIKTKRRRVRDAVDPRHVPNPDQARRLLAGCESLKGHRDLGPRLHAYYAMLYYAGTRPGEARTVRDDDVTLPPNGWGEVLLSGTSTDVPGGKWTDDGAKYDQRELKHRAAGEIRRVPIPPVLVKILRKHIATYGTAPDGRIFWVGENREPVSGETYRRIWRYVRLAVLTPQELASELAERPYDLRHGNASALINAGVAITEAARRLGHSVAVLLAVYTHWFQTLVEPTNRLMDAVFTDEDTVPGHGPDTGQTGDTPTG